MFYKHVTFQHKTSNKYNIKLNQIINKYGIKTISQPKDDKMTEIQSNQSVKTTFETNKNFAENLFFNIIWKNFS